MRLNITYASSVPDDDKVWYIATTYTATNPGTIERELERLAGRIKLVGKEVLGDDLHQVSTLMFPGSIGFCVTKGITSGSKRFDFRSFLGWVEIFDLETGLATRAAMPPFR